MSPAEILAEANRQCEAATQAADHLAQAIGIHFGVEIGEHSQDNDPWATALDVIESADPPADPAQGVAGRKIAPFDLARHLRRQMRFSASTFGSGARVNAIIDHIGKELAEVRASCGALAEWIDIIILGLDGAWRSGAGPQEIIHALVAKQRRNERRCWPDWRTAAPDKAIEHVRTEEPKRERVYISGPMSGIEEHNFPAFHAAAAKLRAAGFEVVNPAEINTDPGMSWAQCLRNDMAELAHCDTLALLPQWQISSGAHLELHVAHRLQMRIVMVDELTGGDARSPYIYRASTTQAAPQPAAPRDEDSEATNEWRRLALQFDGHRMQAMGWLKAAAKELPGTPAWSALREFINAPPLRGEAVLAQRIAALATQPQGAAPHPDDTAADALATLMKAKLAKQRAKGYAGWDTPECTQEHLSNLLRDHVGKGDPVDVANFCAFLSARGEGIAPAAPSQDAERLPGIITPNNARAAFEAWASTLHMRTERWAVNPDLYDDDDAISAWQGWEAGVIWAIAGAQQEGK